MVEDSVEAMAKSEFSHLRIRAVRECGRDLLNVLSRDSDWRVRVEVAKRGEYRDLIWLMSDPNRFVRAAVAENSGRYPEILDYLVKDRCAVVRAAVASVGLDRHLDFLIRDDDCRVLCAVAARGRGRDCVALYDCRFAQVRMIVARYACETILKKMVRDASWQVRLEIVKRGFVDLLPFFMEDTSVAVSEAVWEEFEKIREKGI